MVSRHVRLATRDKCSAHLDGHTRGMHKAADNESGNCTTGEMQARALLHIKVSGQAALSKEVCRELDRTAETCPDHGCTNTAVNTL